MQRAPSVSDVARVLERHLHEDVGASVGIGREGRGRHVAEADGLAKVNGVREAGVTA